MLKKGSLFIIGADGTFLDDQRGKLRALDSFTSVIQVLAPFDSDTVVEVSYLIYGANNETVSQALAPTEFTGADVLASSHSLYSTCATWVLWEVPVTARALAKISKYKTSQVGISFSFKERYTPTVALLYEGTFGLYNDLPASADTLGDYYVCDAYNYTSAVASETFNKNDIAYWTGSAWAKPEQFLLVQNTSTINLSVSGSMLAVVPDTITDDAEMEVLLASIQAALNTLQIDMDAIEGGTFDVAAVSFDTTAKDPLGVGDVAWNDTLKVLEVRLTSGYVLRIGMTNVIRVLNSTGSTIQALNVVKGSSTITLYSNTDEADPIGITGEAILNAQSGNVVYCGLVVGDTSSFSVGDVLYAGTSGALVNVLPSHPAHVMKIGTVLTSHATTGTILVDMRREDYTKMNRDLSNQNVSALYTPTADTDIVVKKYVDDEVAVNAGDILSLDGRVTQNEADILSLSSDKADVTYVDGKISDTESYADNAVSAHNVSGSAHADIRALISALQGAFVYRGAIMSLSSEIEADKTLLDARILVLKSRTAVLGDVLVDLDENEWYYDGDSWENYGQAIIGLASTENDGLMSSAQFTKLYDLYTKAQLDLLFDDIYVKSEVDALLDQLKAIYGWEDSLLATLATTQTILNSAWSGYDYIILQSVDATSLAIASQIVAVGDLTENADITLSDASTFVVGTTSSTFTGSNKSLKVIGLKVTPISAELVTYDNATSALTATNVQDAIDEVEGRLDTAEGAIDDLEVKDVIHDSRINAIEEQLRKSFSAEDTATASGTDIISLGNDVANAPLNVLVEGGLLDAEQTLVGGDFTSLDGFTQVGTVSIVSGRLYVNGTTSYVFKTASIPTSGKTYIRYKYELVSGTLQSWAGGTSAVNDVSVAGSGSFSKIYTSTGTENGNIVIGTASLSLQAYVDDLYTYPLSTLISNKQYSPIYDTTFDLMSDAEIKAQMDAWVLDGTLPNDIMAVSMDKRVRAVGKNLFDKNNVNIGSFVNHSNGEIESNVATFSTDYIQVKPSTQYIFSPFLITYAFYDENKTYISGDDGQTSFTTTSSTRYIRFRNTTSLGSNMSQVLLDSQNPQLELGSTATTYQPYISSDLYLQSGEVGYRLPNLVRDTIEMRDGKAYFVQRVQKYVLVSGDTTTLITTTTNVDVVLVSKKIDSIAYNNTTYSAQQWFKLDGYIWISGFVDDVSSVGKVYETNETTIGIIVAKGTYASLAEAQSALAGTVIYYQLATPIETEILAIGNAQGTPNGTVYVDDIVWNTDIYTTNITVDREISELVSITLMNADGSETQLDVADATLAGDGLSFTHTDLSAGDAVRFTYVPVGDYFLGNTDITYYDNPFIVADSVTSTVYKLVPTIASGVLTWTIEEV